MTTPFMPGLDLSRIFFEETVQPILAQHFPALRYSAALLGPGSDVQGFDTAQSMDHDWGPRLLLFLREDEHATQRDPINEILRTQLPTQIRGFSTNLAQHESGTRWMQAVESGPINHGVKIVPYATFFRDSLKRAPNEDFRVLDWLTVPGQILREVTGGAVFHDDLGLTQLREHLHYYPHDVWLYLIAAQWTRIGQEGPFAGRCAQTGDELGSRIIATRLVRDVMRLCFLLERQYIPYSKWLGTAFARLKIAAHLQPILLAALAADTWPKREEHLCAAYERVAQQHNVLAITPPGPTKVAPFFDRPFSVISTDDFVTHTRAAITDKEVLALPPHIGATEQFVDSTDVLSNPEFIDRMKAMYVDKPS